MADLLFRLEKVRYSYLGTIPALSGIDVSIPAGAKVAIIGANGTGKSTLLAILDALLFPDQGTVSAFGEKLSESKLRDPAFARFFRSKVGFVFQNPDAQLFCPTVKEDIVFGPLQLGVAPAEVEKRLAGVAASLKIDHLLDRAPYQLSIGEKKKVAIATVLAIRPAVLLLDEPTAGLDPQTTRDIIDILQAENRAGSAIVTATHDMHIVEEIADTVHVFCSHKTIIRSGHPSAILSDSCFLQEHNLVHAHAHRHHGALHSHPHLHAEHHAHD